MASKLRQRSPGDPVLERLDELRRDSVRAERVYQYVATDHKADASVTDLLHVLREAPDLALELRANTRQDAIAAVELEDGEYRYAVWQYSFVEEKLGDESPESRSWQYRSGVQKLLENREPRIRLREDTELADLQEDLR